MSLQKCRILEFPKIRDIKGNLTYIEGSYHVPFDIKRIYYLYDVPGGGVRGGHAHRDLEQVIIAINGSFDVSLDDGVGKAVYQLRRANEGLYLCSGIWRELDNFTSGSVCLVIASHTYDEADYFRQYEDFIKAVKNGAFPE